MKVFYAYKSRSPIESVLLGTVPDDNLGETLALHWDRSAKAISETDARAIVAGEMVPDCPTWLRPFLARELAIMVGDIPASKRWQAMIDFLFGPAKPVKKRGRRA